MATSTSPSGPAHHTNSSPDAEPLRRGDLVEFTPTRLGFGGDAVGHASDGRVVFVRGVAPGERVRARVVQARKRFLRMVVAARLEPGPNRVEPVCPHIEICGGCPWMTTPEETQRTALVEHVTRLLRRSTDAEVPMASLWSEGPRVGWRSTARLHWRDGRLGFHGAGGRDVVATDTCPMMTPELDALRAEVQAGLASALRGTGTLRLTFAPGATSGTVSLSPKAPSRHLRGALASFVAKATRCHGGVLETEGRPRTYGRVSDVFEGVEHPSGGFVQAHRPGNAALVADAVAQALDGGTPRVLELYAGSGNFSFPLAKAGAEVVAVEIDAAAAARLEAGAKAQALRLTAVTGDAAHLPTGPFDVALIDPPRAGAAEAVAALHGAGLRRLVYVACDPATLARDVGWLVSRGWRLAYARTYDLFPNAGHVETLTVLTRD